MARAFFFAAARCFWLKADSPTLREGRASSRPHRAHVGPGKAIRNETSLVQIFGDHAAFACWFYQ